MTCLYALAIQPGTHASQHPRMFQETEYRVNSAKYILDAYVSLP